MQVSALISKKINQKFRRDEEENFPISVLIAFPFALVFGALVLTVNRTLRFRLLYPIVISIIGILIPFCIILKNKNLTHKLISYVYDKPKETLTKIFDMLRVFRKISVSPTPISLNV